MIDIDINLKLFKDELNLLHNLIGHEKDKDNFKLLQQEIKLLNDLITNVLKLKALKMSKPV